MVKNPTGETDPHFILWNLIQDEVKKYTDNVTTNLTREPDIVFTSKDGKKVAIEVEATKKSYNDLVPKLTVLEKYDEWFFVLTNSLEQPHYEQFGPTFTRTKIPEKIRSYFQETEAPSQPEKETKPGSNPD